MRVRSPVQKFTFFEPESKFLIGVLDGITTVADVSADLDAEVSSNGSWGRFKWIGGAKHLSSRSDYFILT